MQRTAFLWHGRESVAVTPLTSIDYRPRGAPAARLGVSLGIQPYMGGSSGADMTPPPIAGQVPMSCGGNGGSAEVPLQVTGSCKVQLRPARVNYTWKLSIQSDKK